MKKEEIATLAIIGIILIIDLITLFYTKKCIAKITNDLDELENNAVQIATQSDEKEDSMSSNNEGNYINSETKNNSSNDGNDNDSSNLSSDNLKSKTEEIYKEWIKMNDILTYYIEHDELEKVNVQFEKIIADYSVDSKEDAVPEISEAIFILKHIEKKQMLTLRNVL